MDLFEERKDQKAYSLYTVEGSKMDDQVYKVVKPLFKKCKTQQEIRDVSYLICTIIYSESARQCMQLIYDNSKSEGKQNEN